MLNIGPAEVLVIALIALIVVGPEQLPGVLRKLGKSAGQLRNMADGLKKDFMSGMDELDPNNWSGEKPRGKGTITDPIIGPGAYGTSAAVDEVAETEDEPTGQSAKETAAKETAAKDESAKDESAKDESAKDESAKDEASDRAFQPVTKPDVTIEEPVAGVVDPSTVGDSMSDATAEPFEVDEGDQQR